MSAWVIEQSWFIMIAGYWDPFFPSFNGPPHSRPQRPSFLGHVVLKRYRMSENFVHLIAHVQ